MAQHYYRLSAKLLAVFCIISSFLSENFYYVGAIAFGIAFCLYFMGRGESLEYDRERAYGLFSFNDKAEAYCNFGWMGLVFLSMLLIQKFWFVPLKIHLLASA